MASWKERMTAGMLYRPGDPELVADRARAQDLLRRFNQTISEEADARAPLLAQLFGALGDGCGIRAPLYMAYGFNTMVGDDVFLDFGVTILDVCPVTIGDRTQIGPGAQILTADQPRDPETREAGLEMGRPVTIGSNVWIGAGALILPGLTIGDDAIVGAGAVVTRNVAPGTAVAGNPARPITPQI